MAKFTNCLQIVNAMPEQDQDALLARLDELQAQGLSPKEAQLQAAIDVLAQVEREGGIRKSPERAANFERWSGGAPVIALGDEHQFRSGQPVVVEALHGTTNADLDEFKRSRANVESDMGAGFYASNTPEDVAANYANVDGPDLTRRVEQLAERLEEDFDGDMDAARDEARKRLSQGAPNTMKLFMRFKNPAVIGGRGETFLDYSEEYNEETDEYGEPTGALVNFVEALRDVAPDFNASDREIESAIGKIFERAEGDGLKAADALNIIKSELLDAYDDDGNAASSEIFRQALSQIGFDGVIDTTVYDKFGPQRRVGGQVLYRAGGMKGMTPDTVHFIAFEPEQIKSATGNSGEFGENPKILKSPERPQFYSQLQRAIEQVPARLDNMGAIAWKQWLTANAPKLGVKAEEVEWSGIKDYLDLQGKKKLSKDELSSYLDDSGVKVSEVVLGAPDYSEVEAWWEDEGGANEEAPFSELSAQEKAEAAEQYANEVGQYGENSSTPKYAQYALPGGENYRELLITLPSKNSVAGVSPVQAARVLFKKEYGQLTEEQQQEVMRRISDDKTEPAYMSSHWSDPNVLAHIRVNDREDEYGNRVLFVEELQSDWGQSGKKQGFGKVTRYEYEVEQDNGQLVRSFRDKDEAEAFAKERGLKLKEIPFTVDTGIPAAPFITKTEGWVDLALKRVAMLAVDGGYDRVAFIDGGAAHERFPQKADGSSTKESFDKFYNEIVPQRLSKVLAKIGGSSVEDVEIRLGRSVDQGIRRDGDEWVAFDRTADNDEVGRFDTRAEAEDFMGFEPKQHTGFDVTDKMRETVSAGVPLFSRDRKAKIVGTLGSLSEDPDYSAGKAGDLEAALRTASRVVNEAAIDIVRGIDSPVVLGVTSIEQSGRNRVPFAAAAVMADAASAEVDTQIVQSSSPKRTSMDGLGRIFSRPIFNGPVKPGRNYVLVDDTITKGGTFAALADHIEEGGGKVAAIIALSGKQYSATISADQATISSVREKFGDVENDFRKATGYGYEGLTQSEARYIANFKPASAVRDRITQEAERAGPQDAQEADDQARLSRDRQTETPAFKRWFGDSKVVDAEGKPLVVYHGTAGDFSTFDQDMAGRNYPTTGGRRGFFFTSAPGTASVYAEKPAFAYLDPSDSENADFGNGTANIMPVYLSLKSPLVVNTTQGADKYFDYNRDKLYARAEKAGADGIIVNGSNRKLFVAFRPTQIKSATGNNGDFDSTNPDIRKSAARKPWFEDLSKLKVSTNYQLGDLLKTSKKLSWWDRTVGTQYNLAQKHAGFKRVFDAVQTFINDVSAYATRAADMAQDILPKLESWRDIGKAPLSAEDVKALRDPIFGGTLKYTRDDEGKIVETDDVEKAGVVFTPEELRSMFKLTDKQIDLYRQFRSATDQSITDLALSDMLRYIGEDGADIREAVMASGNVDVAVGIIKSQLEEIAANEPKRTYVIKNTISDIEDKAEQANRLMDRGYAPLSRFGQYTVYAVGQDGEQIYFSMFENERDANKMAKEMREQYPDATVTTGTMSQESYKLFSGVTPETLALFGESLGLEENGIDKQSEAYQQMLKVAKTNRSAMKRLIQRKGIDGFSEDAGRVLAGFVYSNARQISTNLHAGEIGRSVQAIDQRDGDVKDHAIKLMQYIQNPTEEAQKLKALLFTTFLGGNISSALVNFTQTATTTFPYLSQFDGAASVAKRLGNAAKLAVRGIRNDDELKRALKRAEDEGVVSPQEVFHLMAQAQGKAQLQSGDGTKIGDAVAKANNFMTKATLGWGKLFSAAEQANRRIAFIAAYQLARDKGMENPFAFAEKAVVETQFSTNKGIRPAWARGAVGGVLFTFKGFTIAYLELLNRMLGNGPEGKKAFALALGVLFLFAGAGGLPFVDDLDDVVDGFAQRVLGKAFDSKQKKKEFFASIFGQTGAEFVMGGLTSLPGAPVDLSGRLGLGNIAPGTGFLPKKANYQRDSMEIFGPAGSLFSNYAAAVGALAQGDIGKAAETAAPLGIQNFIKGWDMAQMGYYRDTKGRKVIDVEPWEAVAKAVGFQPGSVKRVQDATSTQQGLIAQNKLRETEIADKWAAGRIERNPAKVEEAKAELAEWNRKNPGSPISIDQGQINKRVQQAMMSKAQRLEKTAPKEIRQSVKQELDRAN